MLSAIPFSIEASKTTGLTIAADQAHAVIGRPLTPGSVAGKAHGAPPPLLRAPSLRMGRGQRRPRLHIGFGPLRSAACADASPSFEAAMIPMEASRVSRFWRFSQCHAQPLELKCEAEQRKQRNYQHDSTTCHQQDIDTRTKLRHMPKNYDRE